MCPCASVFSSLSVCSASPWTTETIKLVTDQRAGLAGCKHFRHIKCGATLLASPHLHTVSPRLPGFKLDQIGQGEWCYRGGRKEAVDISFHHFFKGLTSNASVIHFTTGVVLESDFELFVSTMTKYWRKRRGWIYKSCWREGGRAERVSGKRKLWKSTKIKTNTLYHVESHNERRKPLSLWCNVSIRSQKWEKKHQTKKHLLCVEDQNRIQPEISLLSIPDSSSPSALKLFEQIINRKWKQSPLTHRSRHTASKLVQLLLQMSIDLDNIKGY